ncbi:MAG: hypothetical protein Q8Q85_00020 [Gemmatimonadales bacterium]|nr:hypothetical protein [Gemmatimonadales bacterium]
MTPYGWDPLDYLARSKHTGAIQRAAAAEIAQAYGGSWLSSYNAETISSMMFQSPTTDEQAYFKVAYWLARAARVLRSRTLAAKAHGYTIKGALPGTGFFTSGMAEILRDGALALRSSAGSQVSSASVKAILAALGEIATPGAIQSARKIEADKHVIARTTEKTVADVKNLVPDIPRPDLWWAENKVKVYVAGGALALLLLVLAFRGGGKTTVVMAPPVKANPRRNGVFQDATTIVRRHGKRVYDAATGQVAIDWLAKRPELLAAISAAGPQGRTIATVIGLRSLVKNPRRRNR